MISVDIYLTDMNLDTNNGEVWVGGKRSSHLFIFKLRLRGLDYSQSKLHFEVQKKKNREN